MIKCLKCNGIHFKTGKDVCANATVDFDENHNIVITPENNETIRSAIVCLDCKSVYDLNDESVVNLLMHPLVECSVCGKKVTPQELDENRVCTICRVEKMDPNFAKLENADPDVLIRMLAQVRIDNLNLTKANEKIQQEIERAEEIKKETSEPEKEEQENQESTEETPKPKRRGRPPKQKEEQVQEEEASETIDIDDDNSDNESDIEISEDTAPEIPDEVSDMSAEING